MPHKQFVRFLLAITAILAPNIAVAQSTFSAGVASGDVTDTAAILWTRVVTDQPLQVQIGLDAAFTTIAQAGTLFPDASTDFAVKFDAAQLSPAKTYYYRFQRTDNGEISPVGQFETAPPPDAARPFRFVYTGDSNAADQPFHILQFADAEQPDLWFWAGDTIYGDEPFSGLPRATTIDDYHAKHRQNRNDPFLRDLLAQHPVWTQWDDHEVANDYDGADLEPDISPDQMVAGQQAFFDYQPIRPQNVAGDPRRIYRPFRYGSLAEFFILDNRQYRSADLSRDGGGPDPRAFFLPFVQFDIIAKLQDPARTMLGKPQLEWLKQGLKASSAKWKFILSSVPFTSLLILPYDRWDGYEAERYDLLHFIDYEAITGVVLLSADIHANIYNPDVTQFQRDRLAAAYSPCFAVPEFVAGPIATETFRQEVVLIGSQVFGQSPADFGSGPFLNLSLGLVALRVAQENKLAFVETDRFAYLSVDVGADSLTVTHRGILPDPSIESPTLQTLNSVTLSGDQRKGCAGGLPLPICLAAIAAFTGPARRRIWTSPPEPALWPSPPA